jgi:hypothetical protein
MTFIGGLLPVILLIMISAGCSKKESAAPHESEAPAESGQPALDPNRADKTPPTVVDTFPKNGAQDVDPALTEISVTFSEPMTEGSWSWAYKDPYKVPDMPADPFFTDGNTQNHLPVKLKPDKQYELWINTEKFNYFRDETGNPAVPYELKFKTRGEDETKDGERKTESKNGN